MRVPRIRVLLREPGHKHRRGEGHRERHAGHGVQATSGRVLEAEDEYVKASFLGNYQAVAHRAVHASRAAVPLEGAHGYD